MMALDQTVVEIMARGACHRTSRTCGCETPADCFDHQVWYGEMRDAIDALTAAGYQITRENGK